MRLSRPASLFVALASVALVGACDGERPAPPDTTAADSAAVGGTLVLAVAGAPGRLLPSHIETAPSKQITDLVYERLAEIGPSLNTVGDGDFEPMLADAWEFSPDSLAITFRLDSAARWHDGRPVTSEDVRFTIALAKDSAVGSRDFGYLKHVDSVTAPDARTAVFWFARAYPEQFYDAAGRVSILPAHVLRGVKPAELPFHALNSAPMGSGRFRFVRAVPGAMIELAADTSNHRGRPKLDRVLMSVASDPVAASAQLFAGDADVFEALRLENMADVAAHPQLVAHVGPGTAYSFLAFNFRDPANPQRPHPILAEPEMRRALAMAVDRQALVRSVMDSLGVVGTGPYPRVMSEADTTVAQTPFDRQRAAALLDTLGWRDANGDGVRERGGRPLQLTVLLPSSSALRVRSALGLQQQLAAVGVKVELRQLEFRTFFEQMKAGRFDAVLNSWVLGDGSPAGLRDTWHSSGKQNFGRYASTAFDAEVEQGNGSSDREARRAHFGRAFRAMAADVPALWLYEPHNAIAVHRRFRTPPLRATGWWLDLPEWSVPADQRLPRDATAPSVVARR
jgi:peptide/nickel transport system substrate-binding protein